MVVFILMIIAMVSAMLILGGLFSIDYKVERTRLVKLLDKDIKIKIENIKTYGQELNGWKNNFPSSTGLETTTLHVGNDFILVSDKSKFPFLYHSELQPFVITTNPESFKSSLNFKRIYNPLDLKVSGYGNDLEITIRPEAIFGHLKIFLTFENIGRQNLAILIETVNWAIKNKN